MALYSALHLLEYSVGAVASLSSFLPCDSKLTSVWPIIAAIHYAENVCSAVLVAVLMDIGVLATEPSDVETRHSSIDDQR
jgi:hypothetical protein